MGWMGCLAVRLSDAAALRNAPADGTERCPGLHVITPCAAAHTMRLTAKGVPAPARRWPQCPADYGRAIPP